MRTVYFTIMIASGIDYETYFYSEDRGIIDQILRDITDGNSFVSAYVDEVQILTERPQMYVWQVDRKISGQEYVYSALPVLAVRDKIDVRNHSSSNWSAFIPARTAKLAIEAAQRFRGEI